VSTKVYFDTSGSFDIGYVITVKSTFLCTEWAFW